MPPTSSRTRAVQKKIKTDSIRTESQEKEFLFNEICFNILFLSRPTQGFLLIYIYIYITCVVEWFITIVDFYGLINQVNTVALAVKDLYINFLLSCWVIKPVPLQVEILCKFCPQYFSNPPPPIFLSFIVNINNEFSWQVSGRNTGSLKMIWHICRFNKRQIK